MKKLTALFLAIMVVFTFAACENKENKKSKYKDKGMSAAECYAAVIEAETLEEFEKYTINKDGQEYYEGLKESIGGRKYSVEAKKLGEFKDYEVFGMVCTSKTDKNEVVKNFELFEKKGDDYYLVLNASIAEELYEQCLCNACKGNGTITTGQNICSICSGTGVQTIPNAYYDAVMGWMPQTVGCGGCGGSGYTGNTHTTDCSTCKGIGFIFK